MRKRVVAAVAAVVGAVAFGHHALAQDKPSPTSTPKIYRVETLRHPLILGFSVGSQGYGISSSGQDTRWYGNPLRMWRLK